MKKRSQQPEIPPPSICLHRMTTWKSELTFKFHFVYSECASVPKLFLSNNIHNFLSQQFRDDNHAQTPGIYIFPGQQFCLFTLVKNGRLI